MNLFRPPVAEISKEVNSTETSDLHSVESRRLRLRDAARSINQKPPEVSYEGTYLTAGEKEVRAWTIENGTKAPQAAGKIHSDFEKGFIRAEIVDYDVLVELGSFNAAKEKGKVRSEGKDYVIKDGDVVLFRFNV